MSRSYLDAKVIPGVDRIEHPSQPKRNSCYWDWFELGVTKFYLPRRTLNTSKISELLCQR